MIKQALLVLNSTCSALVVAIAVTHVIFSRTAHAAAMFVGAVCTAVIGMALKRIIRTARPQQHGHGHAASLKQKQGDYGMPSSHANALSYWLMMVLLHSPSPWLSHVSLAYVALVLSTRVLLTQHHTWQQIAAGVCLGSVCAFTWDVVSLQLL